MAPSPTNPLDTPSYANALDRDMAGVFERREADWRNGAVVYQVLVDRFAPAADLEAKRHLYPAPKRLRAWDEVPSKGQYLPDEKLWSHEIDFWGGDLASTLGKLDHVAGLGVDVLYLNPIVLSFTNHRYDALDYAQVAPEFGTRADVAELADALHAQGMKLVLDGVFNHLGRNSEIFRSAESDPDSPYRDWFDFGDQYASGVRAWERAENLPELVLENPAARDYLFAGRDSIVRSYLRDGVDGWRLDVAFDLGFRYLEELTNAAHTERPGSLVLGEIANYPSEWFPALDGVLHWTMYRVLTRIAAGTIGPAHGRRMLQRIYADSDYEHMLKSWVYLDNHDTARLAHNVPDEAARRMAMVLQFTLPGSPNVYYGSELGMVGGEDPEMRAPMRWDLASDDNPWFALTKQLVGIRREHRALRVGNIRWLETDRLIGFQRYTDRAGEGVVVLANPADEPVAEPVLFPDAKVANAVRMVDLLGGQPDTPVDFGLLNVALPAHGAVILSPNTTPEGGYSPFKRVQ
jgi:cyclomaltodextrinase